ncbi:retrotransposon gag family protein, partial [Xanthomonas translucens]|uniref:retrotransposon gag family protein n=1 Tax=Xanthomonas campestris pv. translucens TaxID=343 RepID=UPI0036DAC016
MIEWLDSIKDIFQITHCPEESKVEIATHYFRGEARSWWRAISEAKLADATYNWTKLVADLRTKFFPPHLRRKKIDEFRSLKMTHQMTVEEYHKKFIALSHFLPEGGREEDMMMEQFELGLHPYLQRAMATHNPHSVQEMYERAANLSRVSDRQRSEDQIKRDRFSAGDRKKDKRQKHTA